MVLEKAEGGEPFCQYMIGNVYFRWDFVEIFEKKFPDEKSFKAYMKENISKCENWFRKAFKGRMYYAGNNLNKYYEKGDGDLILPQPEKAAGIWFYIGLAYEEGEIVPKDYPFAAQCYEKAVSLLTKACEMGSKWGCDYLGKAYFYGLGVHQDYVRMGCRIRILADFWFYIKFVSMVYTICERMVF